MNKTLNTLSAIFIISPFFSLLHAYGPTNFHRPHDVDFRKHEWQKDRFRIGLFCEYGNTAKSRNPVQNKENALQLYNHRESSVGMLLGAPKGSTIYNLANSLGVSAATVTDNSCRGSFKLTGEYEEITSFFFTKYKLPINLEGTFELSLFVPFKSFEFSNVRWIDKTKDVLTADKEFKETISSHIAEKALSLGCLNINTHGFKKSGIGDTVLTLGWSKKYKHHREYLRGVELKATVGVSIPTGERQDVDQALSFPIGNDGCWGIPASMGLNLDFIYNLQAGVDINFLGLFDRTGTYRMKTSRYQTDFLLLHKGEATKSQGPTWQFTLFGQAKKLLPGLSTMVSYHFIKHDENKLAPQSYHFDYNIVNTAESLKEWSAHSFMFHANYAFNITKNIKPQLSLFYKLPITGQRAILSNTFGGQINLNF